MQNSPEESHNKNTLKSNTKAITLKYFCGQVLASSISNMMGVVIGHPLDTIKVRI